MTPAAAGRVELAPGYPIAPVLTGCWQLAAGHGGTRPSDFGELERRLAELVDGGLTTFDCADIYTGVENALGRFLARCARRAEVQIHTKYVPDLDELPTLTRNSVAGAIECSLGRLGVERLDLVQFHWWDYEVPGAVAVAGWLDELRLEGKIRHLGVTNFDAEHLEPILAAGVPIVSNQVQYSVVDRRPAGAMTTLARRSGFRLLTYGSLAGGFLTDRYRGRERPDGELANRSLVKYREILDELGWETFQELLGAVATAAARHEVPTARLAAGWVLSQPEVAGIILGLGSRNRLEERLALAQRVRQDLGTSERGTRLEQALAELDDIVARYPGIAGPVFGLEREPYGRHLKLLKRNLRSGSQGQVS